MNESLQLTKLTINDLDNVLKLQEKIISGLPESQKHFTVHRTKEEFVDALTSPSKFVYGVYIGKSLVAQSILEFLDGNNNNSEWLQASGYQYKASDIAVYKAVLVDPQYRGQGLMGRMLQAREDMSIMSGKKVSLCKISLDNVFSLKNALTHGMDIINMKKEQGHCKVFLQKELSRIDSTSSYNIIHKHSLNLDKPNYITLKQTLSNMLSQGMKGIWNPNNHSLSWTTNSPSLSTKQKHTFTQHPPSKSRC